MGIKIEMKVNHSDIRKGVNIDFIDNEILFLFSV